MKRSSRNSLVLAGAALLVIVGVIVFYANDTKKTQSIELPGGRLLNIYLTSLGEGYDCKFDLLEANTKKALIPRTHFTFAPYPEGRLKFIVLVGAKSGVVGLVHPEDAEHIELLVDPAKCNYFTPNPFDLSEEDKKLGDELLSALKTDFPDKVLVILGTRESALLKRQQDIERLRLNFAKMDAVSQFGNRFSDVLAVSWEPTTIVTNANGIIEARICDDQPSTTWLGPIKDVTLTNGFVLLVSNGIVIGKTYLTITEY